MAADWPLGGKKTPKIDQFGSNDLSRWAGDADFSRDAPWNVFTSDPLASLNNMLNKARSPDKKVTLSEGVVVATSNNGKRGLFGDPATISIVTVYPTTGNEGCIYPLPVSPDDAILATYPVFMVPSGEEIPLGSTVQVQYIFDRRKTSSTGFPVGSVISVIKGGTGLFGDAVDRITGAKCDPKEAEDPQKCQVVNTGPGNKQNLPVSVTNNSDQKGAEWVTAAFPMENKYMNRPNTGWTAGRGGDPAHPGGHKGQDFGTAGAFGVPIYAVLDGMAELRRQGSGAHTGAGWYILINHDGLEEPFCTMYAHLSPTLTKKLWGPKNGKRFGKKRVKKGEQIGFIFTKKDLLNKQAGRTFGPHLHFEMHMTDKFNFKNKAEIFNALFYPTANMGQGDPYPPTGRAGPKRDATDKAYYKSNKFKLKTAGAGSGGAGDGIA